MLLFPFHLGSIIKSRFYSLGLGRKFLPKSVEFLFRRSLMFSKVAKGFQNCFLSKGVENLTSVSLPLTLYCRITTIHYVGDDQFLNIFWWLFVTAFQCTYMDCIMWCSCPLNLNVSESRFWKTTWSENMNDISGNSLPNVMISSDIYERLSYFCILLDRSNILPKLSKFSLPPPPPPPPIPRPL